MSCALISQDHSSICSSRSMCKGNAILTKERETSIPTQAFATHQEASGFSFALHRGGTFFLLDWYMSFACGFWYNLILISLISSVLSARIFQQIEAVSVDIAGKEGKIYKNESSTKWASLNTCLKKKSRTRKIEKFKKMNHTRDHTMKVHLSSFTHGKKNIRKLLLARQEAWDWMWKWRGGFHASTKVSRDSGGQVSTAKWVFCRKIRWAKGMVTIQEGRYLLVGLKRAKM